MENSMSRLLNELSVLTLNLSMQFKQARMLMFKQISQWGLLGKDLKKYYDDLFQALFAKHLNYYFKFYVCLFFIRNAMIP